MAQPGLGPEPTAFLGEIAPRRAIAVAGRDRASFLQGLLTNDIVALQPGSGCYAAWLTAQGRMLTDLVVLESGDMILLDVPLAECVPTLTRLEQYLFSEDVQIADLSASLRAVWLHGAGAPALLASLADECAQAGSWSQHTNARVQLGGNSVVVARRDQLGVPGFCLYVGADAAPALEALLSGAGAAAVDASWLEAARISAGYPVFGVDMTADTIPLEAGIESSAISFTKGCYVGQEVIIRVLHRGQGRVAKKLVALRIEDGVPSRDARVYSGDRDIGWITSAARSARLGPIALAYLHREFLEPGTRVDVAVDGARCAAIVTTTPIG